jgi:PTH1 family peptidyl-tRNA hydrolase
MARTRIADAELWLLKPTAFMNRSGAPVAAAAGFYRVAPTEILVVHDDIDLPPGIARLKQGGGHGGHNGLRDVMATLGADFWRLRLGVGHPGSRDLVLDSVLSRPTVAEQSAIDAAIARSLDIIPQILQAGAQRAMQALHLGNAEPDDSAPDA